MDYKLESLEAAIKLLLQKQYFSEFQSIDGYNRHPELINFYQWLCRNKMISQDENNRIQAAILAEASEDF